MTILLIALAGLAAGFMNVLAGGGSFLTLPAMIAAGLTALGANASSTVALFPAQVFTAVIAHREMAIEPREVADGIVDFDLKILGFISLVGGFFGALLLLLTPPDLFLRIVPWLILFATGVFARGSAIGRGAGTLRLGSRGIYVIQSIVAIYGGYFGGGIGILMLAALTLFGLRDIREMNSIKIVLAMLMNIAAVVTFVLAGLVQWLPALVLAVAAIIGSLAGISAARRIPAAYVRGFVIAIGTLLAAGFLVKAF